MLGKDSETNMQTIKKNHLNNEAAQSAFDSLITVMPQGH